MLHARSSRDQSLPWGRSRKNSWRLTATTTRTSTVQWPLSDWETHEIQPDVRSSLLFHASIEDRNARDWPVVTQAMAGQMANDATKAAARAPTFTWSDRGKGSRERPRRRASQCTPTASARGRTTGRVTESKSPETRSAP